MYSFALYSAVIVAAILGGTIGESQENSAVLVKINPFISKSKKIIQFSGDGRYKRNGLDKSALYLEFPESFFADPKLKRLYNSLIGGGNSGGGKDLKPDKTNIVFQIDPGAFEEREAKAKNKKRDVWGDMAAFQLTIAPPVPHMKKMKPGLHEFVPRHETTKNWCVEAMPESGFSAPPFLNDLSSPSSTETVMVETKCYPSKPSTLKLRICGGTTTESLRAAKKHDPCECQADETEDEPADDSQEQETTPYETYTRCKSTHAVITHFVESLCWTTEACSIRPTKATYMPPAKDIFSTTYKPTSAPSCLPSSTRAPTCGGFERCHRRRRLDSSLKNFFLMNNSPQSCPPFCPPCCAISPPKKSCEVSTGCPTKPSCPFRTSSKCPFANSCSSSCSTDTPSTNYCCPNVRRGRPDDPLRNVLRLFRRRLAPRRVRRNQPPFRGRRRILVYKPKYGLKKVFFRPKENAVGLE